MLLKKSFHGNKSFITKITDYKKLYNLILKENDRWTIAHLQWTFSKPCSSSSSCKSIPSAIFARVWLANCREAENKEAGCNACRILLKGEEYLNIFRSERNVFVNTENLRWQRQSWIDNLTSNFSLSLFVLQAIRFTFPSFYHPPSCPLFPPNFFYSNSGDGFA